MKPIFAEPWPAAWFVLIIPPQGESAALRWLTRQGIAEAWYPSETIFARNRYKPEKRIPRVIPLATGYMFARLHNRPIWDFLFSQSNGKIIDVMRVGERPVALRDADLMAMRQVPERLQALQQAAIEAATIKPGDMATITGGLMDGWRISVDSIKGGLAYFTTPVGTANVTVDRLCK